MGAEIARKSKKAELKRDLELILEEFKMPLSGLYEKKWRVPSMDLNQTLKGKGTCESFLKVFVNHIHTRALVKLECMDPTKPSYLYETLLTESMRGDAMTEANVRAKIAEVISLKIRNWMGSHRLEDRLCASLKEIP